MASIAIRTNDMRFYHKLLKLSQNSSLKLNFFTDSQQIPIDKYDLIVTSDENPEDKGNDRIIHINYENLDIDTIPTLIGMIARNYAPKFQKMVIGIDPGKHIGVAAICDGMILSAKTIMVEELINSIQTYLLTFPAERVFLRIGDQPSSVSKMIFNKIYRIFHKFKNFRLEIVKEASSNVKNSPSNLNFNMNENAAIKISFRRGMQKTHMVRNDVPEGRVKEIQKWSREISGNITLDSELAEAVAKGKLSLDQALAQQVKSKKLSN